MEDWERFEEDNRDYFSDAPKNESATQFTENVKVKKEKNLKLNLHL